MNVTKTLNAYLLANGITEVTVIHNDIFPDAASLEIISRHDPSSAKSTEYIDGSSVGSLQISYYVRGTLKQCREILEKIGSILDNKELTDVEDEATEYKTEATTLPNFVEVDDKNLYIYTAEITANYIHGGC